MSRVSRTSGTIRASGTSGTSRARDRRPLFDPEQSGRLAVQAWVGSRLVLLITVLALTWVNGWPFPRPLMQWDVSHFADLAAKGYVTLTQSAFFPGMPLVLAAFKAIGVPYAVSGTLVSLVGSGFAAWALYRLAGSGPRGTLAVAAWSFAPMAVFTFVPYSEAAFCGFAFWGFWYAKQDRWGRAAILVAAACLFRVSGLFMIGALVVLAVVGFKGTTWKRRLTRVAWMGVPSLVVAGYATFLRFRFGSWTVWFEAQRQGWGRSFDWPWDSFVATLHIAGVIGGKIYSTSAIFQWEVAAFVIGVLLTVWCVATRKLPEAAWVAVQVLALSCQIWLVSIARSMLLWFPLFGFIGQMSDASIPRLGLGTRRVILVTLLGIETFAMIWWATRFFAGAWAG